MMSWGLKISRNSKQNFKFSFSEEQELNIGSAFLCIPGGVLVVSWGCSWVLNQDLSAQFYFLIAKKRLKFPLISITQVSPCSVPSCGLWATSAQVKLAGLMAMWGTPKGSRNTSFSENLKRFTCSESKIQFSR